MAFVLFGKTYGAAESSEPVVPLRGVERTYTQRQANSCLDGKYYPLASGRRVSVGEVFLDVTLADIEVDGQVRKSVWDSVGVGETLNAGYIERLFKKSLKESGWRARCILPSVLREHFDEKGNCLTNTNIEFTVVRSTDEVSERLAAEYQDENSSAPDIAIGTGSCDDAEVECTGST